MNTTETTLDTASPEANPQPIDTTTAQMPVEVDPTINPYLDRIFEPTKEYPGRKRSIVLWPDERLQERSEQEVYFGEGLARFAADLVATASAADAAGLAAVQVGALVRVVAIRVSMNRDYVVLVNPIVYPDCPEGVEAKDDTVLVTEGCLSFPGTVERVLRQRHVQVEYDDLKGNRQTMKLTVDSPATYVAAQAVQHEVEHLDGKLLIDHLNIVHRDRLRTHMKQVKRRTADLIKKTGGKVPPETFMFGFTPDPIPKPEATA